MEYAREVRLVFGRRRRVTEPLNSAVTAARFFRSIISEREMQEHFAVVGLDSQGRPQAWCVPFVGSLNFSLVHPREVLGPMVACGVATLMVAHNHPSGDPKPSREDFEVTDRLSAACKILGIPLLDHIVLGSDDRYTSLKELGRIL